MRSAQANSVVYTLETFWNLFLHNGATTHRLSNAVASLVGKTAAKSECILGLIQLWQLHNYATMARIILDELLILAVFLLVFTSTVVFDGRSKKIQISMPLIETSFKNPYAYVQLGGKKNLTPPCIKWPKRYIFWDFGWEIDKTFAACLCSVKFFFANKLYEQACTVWRWYPID